MTRKKVSKKKVINRDIKESAKKTMAKLKATVIPVTIANTEKFSRPKFIANRSLRDLETEKAENLEVEIDDLLEDLEELNKEEDDILFKLSENKNKKSILHDQLLAIKAYRQLRKWTPANPVTDGTRG